MISEQVKAITKLRNAYIEMMAAAYLKATKLQPEEVTLVEEWDKDRLVTRFYFAKKVSHED
jgi:hypothetical protein